MLLEAAGLHHRHNETCGVTGGEGGDSGEVGEAGALHLVGTKVTTVVMVCSGYGDGVRLHLQVMPQISNLYVITSGEKCEHTFGPVQQPADLRWRSGPHQDLSSWHVGHAKQDTIMQPLSI